MPPAVKNPPEPLTGLRCLLDGATSPYPLNRDFISGCAPCRRLFFFTLTLPFLGFFFFDTQQIRGVCFVDSQLAHFVLSLAVLCVGGFFVGQQCIEFLL